MKTISILSFVLAALNLVAQPAAGDVACAEPVNYYAEFADLMHDEMIAGATPSEPSLDFKKFSSKYLNYKNHVSSHCPAFGQPEPPVCAGLQADSFHNLQNCEMSLAGCDLPGLQSALRCRKDGNGESLRSRPQFAHGIRL